MRLIPIWEHWPQKYWEEAEWRYWEKAGRPRVPREMRLGADDPEPITLPIPPPTHTLGPFPLHPRKSSARDARGRAIDRLLEKHLGRR